MIYMYIYHICICDVCPKSGMALANLFWFPERKVHIFLLARSPQRAVYIRSYFAYGVSRDLRHSLFHPFLGGWANQIQMTWHIDILNWSSHLSKQQFLKWSFGPFMNYQRTPKATTFGPKSSGDAFSRRGWDLPGFGEGLPHHQGAGGLSMFDNLVSVWSCTILQRLNES